MPELPEVETVRQGLNHKTLAQEIVGGDVLLARTIAPPISPTDFLAHLQGVKIHLWHRQGKYLLAELHTTANPPQSAGWLGVHLRMTGQLLWVKPETPLQKHTRVRLFFAGHSPEGDSAKAVRELRFVDQRTFGRMWWVPPETDVAKVV
ncbi:formamidopyrimidine-DNA glycosylase, partial [Planktothricoides sp. SR001]|uniref:DNA-formamidopyrimidine glycosylase family protein n=1 Tax=Planktothricoides sp. SR001 TaxID=1705388 RepID=UPI0006C4A56E